MTTPSRRQGHGENPGHAVVRTEVRRRVFTEQRMVLWQQALKYSWGRKFDLSYQDAVRASLVLQGLIPTVSCAEELRYGSPSDGGKVLCNPGEMLAGPDCLVYSFGVSHTCEMERELYREMPNCQIHMFDPNLSSKLMFASSRCWKGTDLHFHRMALSGEGSESSKTIAGVLPSTLTSIMNQLGHSKKRLHMLKMDIEGHEYATMEFFQRSTERKLPEMNLLLMEVHNVHLAVVQQRLIKMVKWLSEKGFSPYFLERNPFFAFTGAEVAFVNRTALYNSMAHPQRC